MKASILRIYRPNHPFSFSYYLCFELERITHDLSKPHAVLWRGYPGNKSRYTAPPLSRGDWTSAQLPKCQVFFAKRPSEALTELCSHRESDRTAGLVVRTQMKVADEGSRRRGERQANKNKGDSDARCGGGLGVEI